MIVNYLQSAMFELWQKSCGIICDPRTTLLRFRCNQSIYIYIIYYYCASIEPPHCYVIGHIIIIFHIYFLFQFFFTKKKYKYIIDFTNSFWTVLTLHIILSLHIHLL